MTIQRAGPWPSMCPQGAIEYSVWLDSLDDPTLIVEIPDWTRWLGLRFPGQPGLSVVWTLGPTQAETPGIVGPATGSFVAGSLLRPGTALTHWIGPGESRTLGLTLVDTGASLLTIALCGPAPAGIVPITHALATSQVAIAESKVLEVNATVVNQPSVSIADQPIAVDQV